YSDRIGQNLIWNIPDGRMPNNDRKWQGIFDCSLLLKVEWLFENYCRFEWNHCEFYNVYRAILLKNLIFLNQNFVQNTLMHKTVQLRGLIYKSSSFSIAIKKRLEEEFKCSKIPLHFLTKP